MSTPRIHRVVYVYQAPLQNRTADWSLGSKGCYDAATLAALQAAVRGIDPYNPIAFAKGNADDTLGTPSTWRPPPPWKEGFDASEPGVEGGAGGARWGSVVFVDVYAAIIIWLTLPLALDLDALLASETNKADREALERLMADHTQGDWRAVVRGLERQEALIVAGEKSDIFPAEGCTWVADNAPRAKSVLFRGCGHWLYIERPDEFALLVARFAVGGLLEVEGGEV